MNDIEEDYHKEMIVKEIVYHLLENIYFLLFLMKAWKQCFDAKIIELLRLFES